MWKKLNVLLTECAFFIRTLNQNSEFLFSYTHTFFHTFLNIQALFISPNFTFTKVIFNMINLILVMFVFLIPSWNFETPCKDCDQFCLSAIFKSICSRTCFQVVGCLCPKGFSGKFCENAADVCQGKPCFRGLQCQSDSGQFTCGDCPDSTISKGKEGYKCFKHGL